MVPSFEKNIMSLKNRFTPQDLDRIKAAVKQAEEKISGEIVPVFVERSGFYTIANYRGGMVAAVAIAPAALAGQLALGMIKGRNRAAIARTYFPEDDEWFRRNGWVYTWAVPLTTWLWLYAFLASAASRRIVWRGREYQLRYPPKPAR